MDFLSLLRSIMTFTISGNPAYIFLTNIIWQGYSCDKEIKNAPADRNLVVHLTQDGIFFGSRLQEHELLISIGLTNKIIDFAQPRLNWERSRTFVLAQKNDVRIEASTLSTLLVKLEQALSGPPSLREWALSVGYKSLVILDPHREDAVLMFTRT